MSETQLQAETRSEFGKGAARRVRRDGRIPAVMYGHGTAPVHLTLPGHATMLALKVQNALLTIQLDGDDQLALVKDVQRDVVRGHIEHVDLVVVRRGEKVTVDVPIHVIGDAAPETLVNIELNTVSVQVAATSIPENIEVDVTGREVGQGLTAGELSLPAGATLVTDPTHLVVNVMAAPTVEAVEAELAEAEAEAGIEHEAPQAESDGGGDAAGAAAAEGSADSE